MCSFFSDFPLQFKNTSLFASPPPTRLSPPPPPLSPAPLLLVLVVVRPDPGTATEHRVHVRELQQLLVQPLVRLEVLPTGRQLHGRLRDPLEARGVGGDGEAGGGQGVADGAELVHRGEDAPAAAAGGGRVVGSGLGGCFEDLGRSVCLERERCGLLSKRGWGRCFFSMLPLLSSSSCSFLLLLLIPPPPSSLALQRTVSSSSAFDEPPSPPASRTTTPARSNPNRTDPPSATLPPPALTAAFTSAAVRLTLSVSASTMKPVLPPGP